MKRIIYLVLCLCLIASLPSCAKPQTPPKTTEKEEDISLLSRDKLYETALEKTYGLTSSLFLTKAFIEGGSDSLYTVRTARIREGYDGFSYSREGLQKVYFSEQSICVENRLGAFRAPATSRLVQEYLQGCLHPLFDLPKDALSDWNGEGLTVSFSLTDVTLLALYANAFPEEKGEFSPTSLTGTAQVSKTGFFETVTLSVKGVQADGEEITLVLESQLEQYRSEEIQIGIPASEYTELGDIRIPHLLASSIDALERMPQGQATLLSTEAVGAAEQARSYSEQIGFYQNLAGDFYLSRQSLKTLPETDREYRFYQLLQQNGQKSENEYNLFTASLLSESSDKSGTSPWGELLQTHLLPLDAIAQPVLTDDGTNTSVSFTLSSIGIKALSERLSARFAESGALALPGALSGTGVFTIHSETGVLTAFSVAMQSGEGAEPVSCQYSLTLDQTKDVEVPGLQIPTPTNPGDGGEDHEH